MNGEEEREAILGAAIVAFQRGCAQAAGGRTFSLAGDVERAVRAHYEEILADHEDEILAAFRSTNGMWRDAIATVEETGRTAFAEATTGVALGTAAVVEASHFSDAARRVETAKLASRAGSNWCAAV
jgi:hypothetical protein